MIRLRRFLSTLLMLALLAMPAHAPQAAVASADSRIVAERRMVGTLLALAATRSRAQPPNGFRVYLPNLSSEKTLPPAVPITLTVSANIYEIHGAYGGPAAQAVAARGAQLSVGPVAAAVLGAADNAYVQIQNLPSGEYVISVSQPGYHRHEESIRLETNNPAFWDCGQERNPFAPEYGLEQIPLFPTDWTFLAGVPTQPTLVVMPTATPANLQAVVAVQPTINSAYSYLQRYAGLPHSYGRQYILYDPGHPSAGCAGNPIYLQQYPAEPIDAEDVRVPVHELVHNFVNGNVVGCLGLGFVQRTAGWYSFVHVVTEIAESRTMAYLGYLDAAASMENPALAELARYEALGSPWSALQLCDGRPISVSGQTLDPFLVVQGMVLTIQAEAGGDFMHNFLNQKPFYAINADVPCDPSLLAALGEYMLRAARPYDAVALLDHWHFPHQAP